MFLIHSATLRWSAPLGGAIVAACGHREGH
jgi:hypothetical protein